MTSVGGYSHEYLGKIFKYTKSKSYSIKRNRVLKSTYIYINMYLRG